MSRCGGDCVLQVLLKLTLFGVSRAFLKQCEDN